MAHQPSSREDEKTGGIQVIARAAKILNALGEQPGGMSLGEIAQAVKLPRSTVQRIVAALDSAELVRSSGGRIASGTCPVKTDLQCAYRRG